MSEFNIDLNACNLKNRQDSFVEQRLCRSMTAVRVDNDLISLPSSNSILDIIQQKNTIPSPKSTTTPGLSMDFLLFRRSRSRAFRIVNNHLWQSSSSSIITLIAFPNTCLRIESQFSPHSVPWIYALIIISWSILLLVLGKMCKTNCCDLLLWTAIISSNETLPRPINSVMPRIHTSSRPKTVWIHQMWVVSRHKE